MRRRDLLRWAPASVLGFWYAPNDYLTMLNKPAGTTYDVVVYGGTVAGINAAYTAGLQGAKVALLEPTNFVGGMTGPGGLLNIDQLITYGNLIGGTWWQEYQTMACLAGQAYAGSWPTTTAPSNSSSNPTYTSVNSHRPTPLIAMQVMKYFAHLSPNVDVFYNCAIATTAGSVYPAVTMNPTTKMITSLATSLGVFKGKVFIDASYEGDVLAAVANQYGLATYVIGRESSSQYSEALAGRQLGTATTVSGVSFTSNSLPRGTLKFDPGGSTGQADSHVQPINFRIPYCPISGANGGGVAFAQPAGYDATQYQVYGDIATSAGSTTLSNCIAQDFLFGSPQATKLSNDAGGGLPFIMHFNGDAYPDATPTQRATQIAAIKTWYQGLLYACANDSHFPSAVRADAATWGYANQFSSNGGMPYQPYIREGRRMVGKLVMTQSDCLTNTTKTNSICWTSYGMDIHVCAAYASSDGTTYTTDGGTADNGATYGGFQIDMNALVPQAGQCKNLIVPVCMSASHIAWGAIRFEPTFAAMGDAAGLMAYRVSSGADTDVQSITYTGGLTTLLTSINAKYT